MWFQTVILTNTSTAGMRKIFSLSYSLNQPKKRFLGLHLLPNSLSISMGSIFAGWMMHATGRYKTINLIFGALPFVGTVLIYRMREDSGPIQSWLSIVRRSSSIISLRRNLTVYRSLLVLESLLYYKLCSV